MIIFQIPKKEVVLIKVVQSQVVEVKRSVYVQTDEIPRKALETISRLITTFLAFSAHFCLTYGMFCSPLSTRLLPYFLLSSSVRLLVQA